jgi:hypothetical protein
MLLLLLHQIHFLLLQLLCFSLFSFFRLRSSSIFRLLFLFFFNSSAPSDPYSRSAAPDTTAAAAASSTPSISNLKNKFAAKTLPKLLHFPPPLILVLCSPSTPLLLPMLIILFQLLPPPPTLLLLLLHQLPSISNLKKRICQKTKTLRKLLHFPPLLFFLLFNPSASSDTYYSLSSARDAPHFCSFINSINPAISQTDFATNEFHKRAAKNALSCGRFRHEKLRAV